MLASLTLAKGAEAQVTVQPIPLEAQRRWNLAFELARQGDYSASVAELRAVYALRPTAQVIYYIGLHAARKGNPVEAVEALEKALVDSASLLKEELAEAKKVLEEQKKRVGGLIITSNVNGAQIEVDGIPIDAKTPLSKAIRVASGEHVVLVDGSAQGYLPARRRVSVAGLEEMAVAVDLSPGAVGRVEISVSLPDVEVWVGGELMGRTPFSNALKLMPGTHSIEFKRAGYKTARRDLRLGVGDSVTLSEDIQEDQGWIQAHGGWVELELSGQPAQVWMDGMDRGIYGGRFQTAPGVHRLRVEREGFEAVERGVVVKCGETERVEVWFKPTPATRKTYLEGIEGRKNLGIGFGIGGGLVGVGGTALFLANRAWYNEICLGVTSAERGKCPNFEAGMWAGGIGMGIGVVLMATGAWLIGWNDDPHRYDREVPEQPAPRVRWAPVMGAVPVGRGAVVGVEGRF